MDDKMIYHHGAIYYNETIYYDEGINLLSKNLVGIALGVSKSFSTWLLVRG